MVNNRGPNYMFHTLAWGCFVHFCEGLVNIFNFFYVAYQLMCKNNSIQDNRFGNVLIFFSWTFSHRLSQPSEKSDHFWCFSFSEGGITQLLPASFFQSSPKATLNALHNVFFESISILVDGLMDFKQTLRGVKSLAEMHYRYPVLTFLETFLMSVGEADGVYLGCFSDLGMYEQ